MKWAELVLSAMTAFVIGAGGAGVAVMGSGYQMNRASWILAAIVGALAAAKDIRAQLKLPPIDTTPAMAPPAQGGKP